MAPTSLNILGLSLNIFGTVIIAFSLNVYMKSIRLAIEAHEVSIDSIIDPKKTPTLFKGIEKHLSKGKTYSAIFTWIGLAIVVVGFICQLMSYIL